MVGSGWTGERLQVFQVTGIDTREFGLRRQKGGTSKSRAGGSHR